MRKRIFSWAAAKAFRRLLVKYMIIVLVPVLVLVSATALLLRGNFLSAQARKVQDALDSAQSSVNYTLEAVDSIIVGMDKSRLIIPSILQIDAYSRVNVSNLLNNYALLDAFYASLYAYIPQTPDFLYSPSGTMPLSVLAEFVLQMTLRPSRGRLSKWRAARSAPTLRPRKKRPSRLRNSSATMPIYTYAPRGGFRARPPWRYFCAFRRACSSLPIRRCGRNLSETIMPCACWTKRATLSA